MKGLSSRVGAGAFGESFGGADLCLASEGGMTSRFVLLQKGFPHLTLLPGGTVLGKVRALRLASTGNSGPCCGQCRVTIAGRLREFGQTPVRGGTGRAVPSLGSRQPLAFLLPSSVPLLLFPSCWCCSAPGDAGRPSSPLQTWAPWGWSPPGAPRSPSAECQPRCGLTTSHRYTAPEQRDRGRGLEDHAGASSLEEIPNL